MKKLLSLGANCRTRYQIDHFLHKHQPQLKQGSHFFDRLTGGNLEGVIRMLERDLVLRREDIAIIEHEGKFTPGDRASGFLFFHDFGAVHNWAASHAECAAALDAAFENSLQKFAYLGRKTVDLLASGQEVCLLFHTAGRDDLFVELRGLLRRKFDRDFEIVNVLERKEGESARCASVTTILVDDDAGPKKGTPREWEGCDASWEAALSTIY